MAQFATIIDSLGGVEVDIPEPVRDAYTGLNLASAGRHRLSGIDALALVRSRHPEILRDGSWVAMSQADGAQRRSQSTATVMQAVLSAIGQRASNPHLAPSAGAHRGREHHPGLRYRARRPGLTGTQRLQIRTGRSHDGHRPSDGASG